MDTDLPHIGTGRASLRPDLADAVRTVHADFDERVGQGTVDQVLDDVASRFEDASVRAFVPLLVQRLARETLVGHPSVVDLRGPRTAEIA